MTRTPPPDGPPLLELSGLSKRFVQRRGPDLLAADDVTLSVRRGETVALVGESGSGKSTTAAMVAGLIPPTRGALRLDGADITTPAGRRAAGAHRRIQMVFQNPYGSLDPRMRVVDSIAQPLRVHGASRAGARAEALAMLDVVGLTGRVAGRYPHEFSGGQRQRVAIARALAPRPELVILDEAVSALDVSITAQIINLLIDLQERTHTAYLFITHDLSVVRHMADRVAVLHHGRVVEQGDTREVLAAPRDPYTRSLLDALPATHPRASRRQRGVTV